MNLWRKERASMCQKIKEIHGMKPSDILSTCLNDTVSSVDMQEILLKMKIPCIEAGFSALEKALELPKDDAIWGLAASRGEKLIIAYSKKLGPFMRNYVLAHELGHCCLHLPISADFHVELKAGNDVYSDSSIPLHGLHRIRRLGYSKEFLKKESEANKFATQLLLPDFLMDKYKSSNFPWTAQTLSKVLKVPIHVAQAKIASYDGKSGDGKLI